MARQSSNPKTWIETSRDVHEGIGVGASTPVTPISTATPKGRFESSSLKGAIVHGFHVTVDVSSGGAHKAKVGLYESDAGAFLHYEVTVDLNPNTQTRHMIETPSPIFGVPHYKITDVGGSSDDDYTILFYVKTME